MSVFGDFDATVVEPSVSGGSDPVPAGEYKAIIAKSEWKKTAAGTGEYLNLTFEIVAGEHTGKRVYNLLNLKNPSDVAVDIAHRELSAICRAIGVMKPRDEQQLHDIPMMIKVGIEKYVAKDGTDKTKNKILGYVSTEVASAKKSTNGESTDTTADDDSPF